MAQRQFQYEVQPYQEDCIGNILAIFDSLHQGIPFCQALTKHKGQHNYPFPVCDSKNIDIMMETGTGKTFTYIKTMFELNKQFDYKKFIILIPTVPIREGTKTNLEDTKEYFKQLYANEREKEIEVFVYESGQISGVKQFIGTEHLSVLVITPSSFDKDSNILNRPLEHELYAPNLFVQHSTPPKSYLDCLKRLHPIVIMDEPHRFDGDAFKKYFEGFENYCLRFGATFPQKKNSTDTTLPLSNVAYTLDSISSFRQSLVKKIVVYTQDIVQKQDSLAGIQKEGRKNRAVVHTLSNGIVVKKVLGVGDRYNGKSIRKINANNMVLHDESIEKVDYNLSDESLRTMIKEAIKIHFAKEETLFEHGIKALSLFFIPSDTELYRGEHPKIKRLFEEEYVKQRTEMVERLQKRLNAPYLSYLQNDYDANGNLQVNEGYFSGDKGSTDEKIKAGVDQILRNKKRLLSFESPTRFIFSIWALQEGWDNPNVFTICKLSNQGSENSKLQQIGRGLRICVDQHLKRHTIREFDNNQGDFWNVNNLDVVVSNQEVGFVEAIQNEILSNSFCVSDTFTEQDLLKMLKEKTDFDDDAVFSLVDGVLKEKKMIVRKAIIEGQMIYEKSPHFAAILREHNLPLNQREVLETIFASDYKNFVQEKSKISPKKGVVLKALHLADFQKLWNVINQNAFYILENLDNESETGLIANIKTQIESLNIQEILLQTIRKELNIDKIDSSDAISQELTNKVSYKRKVDYLQFVSDLSIHTKTPITFVVKIFNALSLEFKNHILANNPAQALKEITEIVRHNLVSTIKAKIRYMGIEGEVLPNVFLSNNGQTYLKAGSMGKFQKEISGDFSLRQKWIFEDVIEYDSDFEVDIIEQDPDMKEIDFFGKLPKLNIKTPLGQYSPDFCYAVKSATGNKLILVVECKGYKTSTAIPQDERDKIAFAKKYFDYLNEHHQSEKFNISFKERISNVQLSSLIHQSM